MKTKILTLLIFLSLTTTIPAQQYQVEQDVIEAAMKMFPEETVAEGEFKLQYKADIRMHRQGFEIYNYSAISGENELGLVSRVTSSLKQGLAKDLDFLVRFDEEGKVLGMLPIKTPEIDGQPLDLRPLIYQFVGRNAGEIREVLSVAIDGLAAAGKMRDVKAPQGPPEGYKLDFRQLIMKAGDKLPEIKATDVDGNPVNSKTLGSKKSVIIFSSVMCADCNDMIQIVEEFKKSGGKNGDLNLLYVVFGTEGEAKEYSDNLALSGSVVADTAGLISKMFRVPFKPYAMMFDEGGVLKSFAAAQGRQKIDELLTALVQGKP